MVLFVTDITARSGKLFQLLESITISREDSTCVCRHRLEQRDSLVTTSFRYISGISFDPLSESSVYGHGDAIKFREVETVMNLFHSLCSLFCGKWAGVLESHREDIRNFH